MNDSSRDPFATNGGSKVPGGSQPMFAQGVEIQEFGTVRLFTIALAHDARMLSCQILNRILADSIVLYNLYKNQRRPGSSASFSRFRVPSSGVGEPDDAPVIVDAVPEPPGARSTDPATPTIRRSTVLTAPAPSS
jgi:hypothetical protein